MRKQILQLLKSEFQSLVGSLSMHEIMTNKELIECIRDFEDILLKAQ